MKQVQLDEDGNPIEEEEAPADDEDAEQKKVKFDPSVYKWTVTNRKAKNLP